MSKIALTAPTTVGAVRECLSWWRISKGALLVLARKAGITATAQSYPRIQEYPFDSDSRSERLRQRQRMSIICEQSPYYLLFAKGSPESILDRSTHALIDDRFIEGEKLVMRWWRSKQRGHS